MKKSTCYICTKPKLLFLILIITTFFSQLIAQETKEIAQTIFFAANTGEDPGEAKYILHQIALASQEEDSAAVVLLGNILPKDGFPKKGEEREKAKLFLKENLLNPLKEFKGNIIINPGVHEWSNKKNIQDLESFLQKKENLKFWPNDGCSLKREELNDEVVLVMVNSQWFLEDWNDWPYLNQECEIKTREQFFIEFKDDLKDMQGKIILVSIHHPVMTNSRQGFLNYLGGFSKQSFQHPERQELSKRLKTLSRQFEDVIFISGQDRNLQYILDDETPQIISGAIGKLQKTRTPGRNDFAADEAPGFAKIQVFTDGSSKIHFYESSSGGSRILDSRSIRRERITPDQVSFHSKRDFGSTKTTSIYTREEVEKNFPYRKMWGDHYREIYGRAVEVPVLFLDTLPGNPKAINEGGGKQSRSLRLLDDNGHEYTLREMRKSSLRFLQTMFPGNYIHEYLENTIADRIVQDFYTTAHPYAPFAVKDLLETLDILHPNPFLYYVPKQQNLGIFNEDYGNRLYMLEEHAGEENKDFKDFGMADDIISTADLLLEFRETKASYVDESSYIRARLTDMLIGDWDRHEDQWRWAQYKQADTTVVYKPIPRDRDQAFPLYDGLMIRLLKLGFPELRAMQTYGEKLQDEKWFNLAAYPLDQTFLQRSGWEEWLEQVRLIQEKLTDQEIKAAFAALPEDTRDESIEIIQRNLIKRRDNLENIAKRYYVFLSRFSVITGTKKDDRFHITRMPEGTTQIRLIGGDGSKFSKKFNSSETKEIWIYGLEGKDEFRVTGKGDHPLKIKLIGGSNNDTYELQDQRKVKLYDYRSKENTFLSSGPKLLTDNYHVNSYDPEKQKHTTNVLFPSIGFDPDAGIKVGLKNTYTTYNLARNPFTAQHGLSLNYFFATDGFAAAYTGEFAHIFPDWNFKLEALYTSPNYTLNFFGTGNGTTYEEDQVSMDLNRVRIQRIKFEPSVVKYQELGSSLYLKGILESLRVPYDENKFTGQWFGENATVFNSQQYAGAEAGFAYLNQNNSSFRSRGFEFEIRTGYKKNLNGYDKAFAFLKPALALDLPLHRSEIAVLATKVGSEMIFGDHEFYHGATLGGNYNLRGYRNERFNGNTSFFHSTDLRLGLSKIRTNYIPLRIGLSAGFDYGRVWSDQEEVQEWHSNYGGSFYINGFNALTANLGYYISKEGNRFMFSLGFHF